MNRETRSIACPEVTERNNALDLESRFSRPMSMLSFHINRARRKRKRNAGVLASWPAGVPRLRSKRGGEDAAWPAAETAAFRRAAPRLVSSTVLRAAVSRWSGGVRN